MFRLVILYSVMTLFNFNADQTRVEASAKSSTQKPAAHKHKSPVIPDTSRKDLGHITGVNFTRALELTASKDRKVKYSLL